jgi:hypothetical protein
LCRPDCRHRKTQERDMGTYFIAWLLGVPGLLLVVLYLIFR